ncbi:MAG: hypothetical protein AB3N24_09230 [Leisingera sp.]
MPAAGGEPSSATHFGWQNGLITNMEGGAQDAFDRSSPVFEALGKHGVVLGLAIGEEV